MNLPNFFQWLICILLGHPPVGICGSDENGPFNPCRCGAKKYYTDRQNELGWRVALQCALKGHKTYYDRQSYWTCLCGKRQVPKD